MLVELAIGDAYGAAFEYSPLSLIEDHNTGVYYSKHPTHKLFPGQYTDDTQMTIAIAEVLLSEDKWNSINLADKFVFKREPRIVVDPWVCEQSVCVVVKPNMNQKSTGGLPVSKFVHGIFVSDLETAKEIKQEIK